MPVWLRLTCLFGLPDDEQPDHLMSAALGPILRAEGREIAEAPLPPLFRTLLDELHHREQARKGRDSVGRRATNAPIIAPQVRATRAHPPIAASCKASALRAATVQDLLTPPAVLVVPSSESEPSRGATATP
jgi:hypothetical protein